MSPQSLTLPVAGLMTDPGPFTAAPEGGLAEATNVVVLRPGVIEPRPGMVWIVDATLKAGNFRTHQCYSDPNDIIYTWSLDFDDLTTWLIRTNTVTTITGPTSFTRGKIRIAPTGGRALFTSNNGICTLPAQSASPASGSATVAYRAGMPQPDLPIWSLSATGSVPLSSYIRYRFTLRRRLASGAVVESAPTSPLVVFFDPPATAVSFHGWTSAAPYQAYRTPAWAAGGFGELIAGDELCVYRSAIAANYDDVSDELRLRVVLPFNVATNAFVDPRNPPNPWTDTLGDDEWDGEPLYTNATEEGAALANFRPEYARDATLYNGMTFYGGAMSTQTVRLTLNALVGPGATDPQTALTVHDSGSAITGAVTTGSPDITGLPAAFVSRLTVGQVIQTLGTNPDAVAAFPANTQIITILSTTSVRMSANSLVTNAALSIAEWDWVEVTVNALTQRMYVVDVVAGSAVLLPDSASVASFGYNPVGISSGTAGAESQWNNHRTAVAATDWERWRRVQLHVSAGQVDTGAGATTNSVWTFHTTDPSNAAFVVKSSKPLAWDRYADAATGITSKQEGGIAELTWSKVGEPEHVPLPYRSTVGDAAQAIRRIVVARNSLLIFKDDGLFQCFGQTPGDLTFELLDRTITLPVPLSTTIDEQSKWLERYDDRVFAMTTRGPMAIGDAGGVIVGQPILESLRRTFEGAYGASNDTGRGMCVDYQSRRVWFMFEDTAGVFDSFAQSVGYILDVDTQTWTVWTFSRPVSAACVRSHPGSAALAIGLQPGGVVIAGGYQVGIPSTSRTMLTSLNQFLGITLTTMPRTYDVWIGQTVTVASVTGTGPYTVTISPGSEWSNPYEGDILIDSAGIPHEVTSAFESETEFTTETSPALGVGSWRQGYPCRVVWLARPEGSVASEKHWHSMVLPFEIATLTNRMRSYFKGYRNTSAAIEAFTDASQLVGATPWAFGAQYKRVAVPTAFARDWALKPGFTIRQAGVWFSTGGLSLIEAEPIAPDKAAR